MSVLCLGEVWLELNAATAPELTETFRAQTGGWGRRLLPSVRRIGRAGGSAGPAGSRPLWPQAGGPAGPGWCGLLPALLHGYLPHTGGVHRSRHRSALPCPHRRAGPWAGAAGGRPVPGLLCLLLFLHRAGGQPPAAGPPQGPCRRPGCRGALLLSFPGWRRPRPTGRSGRPCARPPCSFLTGQTFSF